jgi:hypothetical protein
LNVTLRAAALALLLQALPLRDLRAEDRLDFKTMFYQEERGRMRVIAPTVLYEKQVNSIFGIKLECIYNAITGASPTGAPPPKRSTAGGSSAQAPVTPALAPQPSEHEEEEERDDKALRSPAAQKAPLVRQYSKLSGATPVTTPAPTTTSGGTAPSTAGTTAPTTDGATEGNGVPLATADDTRIGASLEFNARLGRHLAAAQVSLSSEDDYHSLGLALRDAVDFNNKNTALLFGGSVAHDRITAKTLAADETKDTIEALIGVTQLIDAKTFFTINLSRGHVSGYLSDPYKVVELNGQIVPERRPDSKDKTAILLLLSRYVESLRGSAELSYRWYDDSFGITANTYGAAWHQRLGQTFILSPSVRLYDQSAADFYALRFSGNPEFYSSDYRVSPMQAFGYGLKLAWLPVEWFGADIAYERYEQRGKDGDMPADAYPSANIVTVGVRFWF